jgi:hypothetical protein
MQSFLSGTIGGKNVGVSPDCNIYGLKTLNEQGGSVSAILSALDVVVEFAANSGRKSIVSMSLGGKCETEGMYVQYVHTLVTYILLLLTYSCYLHTLVTYMHCWVRYFRGTERTLLLSVSDFMWMILVILCLLCLVSKGYDINAY